MIIILLPLARTLTIVLSFDLFSNASINSLISTDNSEFPLWRFCQLTHNSAATQLGRRFRCSTSTVLPFMIATRATSRPSRGFNVGRLDVKPSSKLRGVRSSSDRFPSWLVGKDDFRSSRFVCLPWKNLHLLQPFDIAFCPHLES